MLFYYSNLITVSSPSCCQWLLQLFRETRAVDLIFFGVIILCVFHPLTGPELPLQLADLAMIWNNYYTISVYTGSYMYIHLNNIMLAYTMSHNIGWIE